MVAPVLVVGRQGQVASALQRMAPELLQRPLVVVGPPLPAPSRSSPPTMPSCGSASAPSSTSTRPSSLSL